MRAKKTKAAKYVTPPVIAEWVGVKVETIYGFIRSGELRAINFGSQSRSRYRISLDDFEAFMKSREVRPTETKPRTRKRRDYPKYV